MKFIRLFLLYLFVFIGILNAGTTGKIAGRIVDETTGEPLPGANVFIDGMWLDDIEVEMMDKMGGATDLNGEFYIINIDPGLYTIKITMMGYEVKVIKKVKVSVDFTTPVNVRLRESALDIGEEIMVIAEEELIRKDLTSSTSVVSDDVINQMPVEQVSDVLEIQAKLVKDAGGGLHVRGGRSGELGYMIDGVPVTDRYSGNMGLNVENNSVSELQVITGTFNAEYGQAMSGIVNIVTKKGSPNYRGKVSSYIGDYVSGNKKTFYNIDSFNPIYSNEIALEGPVPWTQKKLTFFANVRHSYDDGYRYGKKAFSPWRDDLDSSTVSMSYDERLSYMIKFNLDMFSNLSFSYQILGNNREYEDYNHYYKYTPDGNLNRFESSITHILSATHTLSQSTFYELRYAHYYTDYEHYTFENPLLNVKIYPETDGKTYSPSEFNDSPGSYSFSHGGSDMGIFERSTTYDILKLDITSQVTKRHQVKGGVEARFYNIEYYNNTVLSEKKVEEKTNDSGPYLDTSWVFSYPDEASSSYNKYNRKPKTMSAYIQDKMEFQEIVFNVGVRFDYFDSDGKIFSDPRYPNIYNPQNPEWENLSFSELEKFWYKEAEAKYQLSPRLGIGYPISDRGTIHFSYGHFFQMPRFESMYNNPEFKITRGTRTAGNPDLEAEKTVSYEIGLQQQLTSDMTIDITGYYRDIRGWIAQSKRLVADGIGAYTIENNYDYASVRGIVFSLKKFFSKSFIASLDYTYQIADGIDYDKSPNLKNPKIYMVPLGYDQRHTLNAFLGYQNQGFKGGLLAKYWSGQPYTPSFLYGESRGSGTLNDLPINSANKPGIFLVDLKFSKDFKISKWNYKLFLNIYNTFDSKNAVNVYSDTGKPDKDSYHLVFLNTESSRIGGLYENLDDPNNYVEPRKIHLGFTVSF